MSLFRFIAREAWDEARFALKSGIVPLIFIGLTAYILLFLTSADYLQNMGAADVPRNAPSLVYLFTAGDSFFLFFAWAWLYAQPIVRDRSVNLHEIVFTAPVSLRAMLFGRFLGAFSIALLLGASQTMGFVLAPLLETVGLVPHGSMGPTPWAALGWSWLVFIVPLALGTGSIYFTASALTRSVTGAFGAAAILVLAWMFAIIVVERGGFDPALATILDPSGFTDVNRTVASWTPIEKETALFPLTQPLILNRLLWGALPTLVLAIAIWGATRERLLLENEPKRANTPRRTRSHDATSPVASHGIAATRNWMSALHSEIRWQVALIARSRGFWIGMAGMIVFGVVGVFYHMLGHADGPFLPRPENTPPLLSSVLYLFIAFIAAALAGYVMRRDDRAGFNEMLDAAPAPIHVRVVGRCCAIAFVTIVLSLVPAVSSLIGIAIAAPQSLDFATPVLYQLTTLAPALLELVAIAILAHALIRPSGPAYAFSMLATFVLLVNNETGIIAYAPFKIGITPHVALSSLTGWSTWIAPLIALDLFKILVALFLIALAAAIVARGVDSRLVNPGRQLRERLLGPVGVGLLLCVALGGGMLSLMNNAFIEQGHYHTETEEKLEDAEWEQRWVGEATSFKVAGGEVKLAVEPHNQRVTGSWKLHGVVSDGEALNAELPEGFHLGHAAVGGTVVEPDEFADHVAIPLGGCHSTGCDVELTWTVELRGWDSEGQPAWISEEGAWLTSERVMPRLGFDVERMLQAANERQRFGLSETAALPRREARTALEGVAPSGNWQWQIRLHGSPEIIGSTSGPLQFAAVWAPNAVTSSARGMELQYGRSFARTAETISEDVAAMRACVARRLGNAPRVSAVSQLPRGMGRGAHCGFGEPCGADTASRLLGEHLLLAEDPHWDISGTGTGRWLRQQTIASLLARQVIVNAADARQGDGAQWLTAGLSGSVGLLCVADANGLDALQTLLVRGAKETTHSLAASRAPVGALSDAPVEGWVSQYSPLSSLSWLASADAAVIRQILRNVRETGDVHEALARTVGPQIALALLGAPRASDVALKGDADPKVSRWQWASGGWRPVPSETHLLGLRMKSAITMAESVTPPLAGDTLVVDEWNCYERAPLDNRVIRR